MTEELIFTLIPRGQQNPDFDWLNIDCGATRVGKARGLINDKVLTIHSINIFPEFEGRGYGKQTVEMFQAAFDMIVADRVRHTAIGFWEKMGFDRNNNGNYVWRKTCHHK